MGLSLMTWCLVYLGLIGMFFFTALHKRGKLASLVPMLGLLAAYILTIEDVMGRAKPQDLADIPPETQILGFNLKGHGQPVELQIQRPGEAGSQLVEIPWDTPFVEGLEGASRQAQLEGLGMVLRFSSTEAGEGQGRPNVEVELPPARPPKEV